MKVTKETAARIKAGSDDGADATDQLVDYARHPGGDTSRELHEVELACIMAPVEQDLIDFGTKARGGAETTGPALERLVETILSRSGSRIAFMPFSLKAIELGVIEGRRIRLFVDPSKKEAPEIIVTEVIDAEMGVSL